MDNFARASALLAFGLAALSSTCSAQIYRCIGKDGGTTFSDTPCGPDAQVQEVSPPSRASTQDKSLPDAARILPSAPDTSVRATQDTIALRCAMTDFNKWVRSQNPPPDGNARFVKFVEVSNKCRKALHLPDLVVAAPAERESAKAGSAPASATPNGQVDAPAPPPQWAQATGPPKPVGLRPSGTPSGLPDVQVVTETLITTHDVTQGVRSAIGLEGGGIFAAGIFEQHRPKYFKLSKDGEMEWEVSPSPASIKERPATVGSASNGGYWVSGTASAREFSHQEEFGAGSAERLMAATYAYVRRVDREGHVSPPLAISQPGDLHLLLCGTEVGDGYVFSGLVSGGARYANQPVPWIEKVDFSGRQLWQRTLPEDHGEQIALYLGEESCSGLRTNGKGDVAWAVGVRVTAITSTGEAWAKAVSTPSLGHPATFVVQFDSNGNEVQRLRHDFVRNALLLAEGAGWVLVERTVPKSLPLPSGGSALEIGKALRDQQRAFAEESGVSITTLDPTLRELGRLQYRSSELSYAFDAILRTPQGGFLIAGCQQGDNLLAYVSSRGQISAVRKIGHGGMQECSRFALASGVGSGEALLLASNDLWGFRLLKVRYSE